MGSKRLLSSISLDSLMIVTISEVSSLISIRISSPLERLSCMTILLTGSLYTLPLESNISKLSVLLATVIYLGLSCLKLGRVSLFTSILQIKFFSVMIILNRPSGMPVTSDSVIILHLLGLPYFFLISKSSALISLVSSSSFTSLI